MEILTCNGISSNGTREVTMPNDRVCVDFSVEDFVGVASVQYTIEWDESVIEFDALEPVVPAFPGTISTGTTFVNNGQLTFSWLSPNLPSGVTVPDGTLFYRLCFNAVGQLGEFSDISLTSAQTPVEVTDEGSREIGFSVPNPGFVKISDSFVDLEIEIDTACNDQNDGGLLIRPIAGIAPVSYTHLTLPTKA